MSVIHFHAHDLGKIATALNDGRNEAEILKALEQASKLNSTTYNNRYPNDAEKAQGFTAAEIKMFLIHAPTKAQVIDGLELVQSLNYNTEQELRHDQHFGYIMNKALDRSILKLKNAWGE